MILSFSDTSVTVLLCPPLPLSDQLGGGWLMTKISADENGDGLDDDSNRARAAVEVRIPSGVSLE